MSALAHIRITRAAPLTTVQDAGRFGALAYGIAASGPMDAEGWARIGGGASGIEFTMAGLDFTVVDGTVSAGFGGGRFALKINGKARRWPARARLKPGDTVSVSPGASGVYGYVRFAGEIDVPVLLNSRATNTIAGLGGFEGRALKRGDELAIIATDLPEAPVDVAEAVGPEAPFRFVWGLHADLFDAGERAGFVSQAFFVSHRLDRMGIRLEDRAGVFARAQHLSLVSDTVVPGDIQILGDGTPIVLMRDHQPTGGYPRIATLLSADLGRFAQMRPGAVLRFTPVSIARGAPGRKAGAS